MTETRKDLEKEAAQAGVENAEDLRTAQEVKDATDLANGDRHVFMYPGEQVISVIATDRAEADEKYKALKKEQDHA